MKHPSAAAITAQWRTIPVSIDVFMDMEDGDVVAAVRAYCDRLRVCDPYDAANDR